MLLRYGADPRISDRSGIVLLIIILFRIDELIIYSDYAGNYPLHTACQHGDYDSLQLLIEHSPIKPDIDQQVAIQYLLVLALQKILKIISMRTGLLILYLVEVFY